MLRKFKISIDGKEYMVEMEEIGGIPAPIAPVAAAPIAAPTPEAQPAVEAAPVAAPAPSSASGKAMTSPMPGTILKMLVNVGEDVKVNQPLLILEAMKMENEIVAQKDGKVAGIHVTQGEIVDAGSALITIE